MSRGPMSARYLVVGEYGPIAGPHTLADARRIAQNSVLRCAVIPHNAAARRAHRLLPNGRPKWVRCYDNGGKTFDRYTVVFTGRWPRWKTGSERPTYYISLGMSEFPFHPQGFGQHAEATFQIDRPRYAHIGKRIPWEALPRDCKRFALATYRDIWQLEEL